MRPIAKLSILPLGLLAVACGTDASRESAMSDDLRQDLAMAAAGAVELAPSATDTMIVSAIERTPARTPERVSAPKRSAARHHPAPAPEPEAEPAPTPAPAAAEEPEPETVASAPAPSDLPIATRPVPVAYPSGGGEEPGTARGDDSGDVGTVIGTVIGVVIRGGSAGEDHCEIHPPRRRGRTTSGGGISIPGREGPMSLPRVGGLPTAGTTFPSNPGIPRY